MAATLKLKLLISTKTGCEGTRCDLNRLYWHHQQWQRQHDDTQIDIFQQNIKMRREQSSDQHTEMKQGGNKCKAAAERRLTGGSAMTQTPSIPPSLSPSLPQSSLCRDKDGVMKVLVVLADLCSSEKTMSRCSNFNLHPPFDTSVLLLPSLSSSFPLLRPAVIYPHSCKNHTHTLTRTLQTHTHTHPRRWSPQETRGWNHGNGQHPHPADSSPCCWDREEREREERASGRKRERERKSQSCFLFFHFAAMMLFVCEQMCAAVFSPLSTFTSYTMTRLDDIMSHVILAQWHHMMSQHMILQEIFCPMLKLIYIQTVVAVHGDVATCSSFAARKQMCCSELWMQQPGWNQLIPD